MLATVQVRHAKGSILVLRVGGGLFPEKSCLSRGGGRSSLSKELQEKKEKGTAQLHADRSKDGSPGLALRQAAVPGSFVVKLDHAVQLWTVEGEQKACVPPPASPHKHLPASMVSLLSGVTQESRVANSRRQGPGALKDRLADPSHRCPSAQKPVLVTVLLHLTPSSTSWKPLKPLKRGRLSATAAAIRQTILRMDPMSPLAP